MNQDFKASGAEPMEERLIKRLMTSLKCDSCGQHYEASNIDIIGHREDLWFLRVLCAACHTRALVAAVVKESRVPEEVADLAEVERDESVEEVIDADYVLSMHIFLKDFDGDFAQLFRQKHLES